ncbi:nuclear transport factor 2 family protein [Oryzicola mucosus]|uniref:Nuclear transport factor 2 family protein n=1 Tax=Oryzicola mucosus TaxID=2767425 RepID=A0A8J6PLH7_9HYPH|nr:nuclear transport factor 2 family protein [Oryzicola mucosus]MBD0416794.1 nuclear transport factor 2 family protein [Oryzicola mucosus]
MSSLEERFEQLSATVDALQGEAEIRRIVSQYMFLCDIPIMEPGIDVDQKIELILNLYTADATWEGVGTFYQDQFGIRRGMEELRTHFQGFFKSRDPAMLLNCHYLTAEHITVTGESAEGRWVHFQPWIFSDGTSALRSSRLFNAFRKVDGIWKMSRYRTENVFVAKMPDNWWESFVDRSVLLQDQ